MRAVIVVPWRGGDVAREANWAYCRPWWERLGFELFVVEDTHRAPFSRSWCINEGARRAGEWDVMVIIDADTLEDTEQQVQQLVIRTYETGRFGVGHVAGWDLTEEGTKLLIDGNDFNWNRYIGAKREVCDSRVNAVRFDLFAELGGYDERFRGWGHEDVAFTAASTAYHGEGFERIPGNSWHLYHTPQLALARPTKDWQDGKRLANRYLAAQHDWPAMRKILDERKTSQRFDAVNWQSHVKDAPVELVVITNGRTEYLEQTLASAKERLKGNIVKRTMVDDSADPEFAAYLDATHGETFEIHHHEHNIGFAETVRHARQLMAEDADGPEYVFWLEEDFAFDRDIELDELATLLGKPGLEQVALLRGPYFPREHAKGGIIQEHPESYRSESFHGIEHQAHRRFWTTNPNLTRRTHYQIEWPRGVHTESRFGKTLWSRGMHVAFIGDGTPWVSHIGAKRTGHGY